jgi:hypothetical protein
MITGVVNASHEIIIKLPVRDAAGNEHDIETMLDTGFNGSLTLPGQTIASRGRGWESVSNVDQSATKPRPNQSLTARPGLGLRSYAVAAASPAPATPGLTLITRLSDHDDSWRE